MPTPATTGKKTTAHIPDEHRGGNLHGISNTAAEQRQAVTGAGKSPNPPTTGAATYERQCDMPQEKNKGTKPTQPAQLTLKKHLTKFSAFSWEKYLISCTVTDKNSLWWWRCTGAQN